MELVSCSHSSIFCHQKPALSLRFLDTNSFNFIPRRISLPRRITSFTCQSIISTHNSLVADGDFGTGSVTEKSGEIRKLKIPGLPDGSGGNDGSQISSSFWDYRPKLSVHYETSGMENTHAPAVLFLPGFGVGSFHFEKQLRDLGCDYRVWALDFLGQGMSLPREDPAPSSVEEGRVWGFGEESQPWASELVYSVDLWRDQVQHFVEQVWLIGYLANRFCNSGTCN
jgi:hypothetical protein